MPLRVTSAVLLGQAVLVFLLLHLWHSLTRQRLFPPDSMNYVDIARNITRGQGIAQSTLGYNELSFAAEDGIPVATTAQGPGYPLLIALVSRAGIAHEDAALIIPVLAYGGILILAFLLTARLYDAYTAAFTVALLLFLQPLRRVINTALSEAPGIMFILGGLYLALTIEGSVPWPALLAGICAGLAFATRYAFFPCIAITALSLVNIHDIAGTAVRLGAYGCGVLLLVAPLLYRNHRVDGRLLGKARHRSTMSVGFIVRDTLRVLLGGHLGRVPVLMQLFALEASVLLFGVILLARGELLGSIQDLFLAKQRYLLPLWSLCYLGFLVYQRTRIHFIRIRPRLVAPAAVTLVPLWAALLVRALEPQPELLLGVAALMGLLAAAGEGLEVTRAARTDEKSRVMQSERLRWIAEHTTPRDLIIGEDTVDIPFYFERGAISFSPFPYTSHMTYEQIAAYIASHQEYDQRIYVILRKRFTRDEAWSYYFGEFIADLAGKRLHDYAGISHVCDVADGSIYEIKRSVSSAPGRDERREEKEGST